jgi:hypothetical protein
MHSILTALLGPQGASWCERHLMNFDAPRYRNSVKAPKQETKQTRKPLHGGVIGGFIGAGLLFFALAIIGSSHDTVEPKPKVKVATGTSVAIEPKPNSSGTIGPVQVQGASWSQFPVWLNVNAILEGFELTKFNLSGERILNHPDVSRLIACRVTTKTPVHVIGKHPPDIIEIEITDGPSKGCHGVVFEGAVK